MNEIDAKILSIYNNTKEIGKIKVINNKMTITMEDEKFKEEMLEGPYDPDTEGDEAYKFLRGRFARSSTIAIKEGE